MIATSLFLGRRTLVSRVFVVITKILDMQLTTAYFSKVSARNRDIESSYRDLAPERYKPKAGDFD